MQAAGEARQQARGAEDRRGTQGPGRYASGASCRCLLRCESAQESSWFPRSEDRSERLKSPQNSVQSVMRIALMRSHLLVSRSLAWSTKTSPGAFRLRSIVAPKTIQERAARPIVAARLSAPPSHAVEYTGMALRGTRNGSIKAVNAPKTSTTAKKTFPGVLQARGEDCA